MGGHVVAGAARIEINVARAAAQRPAAVDVHDRPTDRLPDEPRLRTISNPHKRPIRRLGMSGHVVARSTRIEAHHPWAPSKRSTAIDVDQRSADRRGPPRGQGDRRAGDEGEVAEPAARHARGARVVGHPNH